MVKRKRIPLNLKGTDETYFRTREISGLEAKPDLDEPLQETVTTPPKTAEVPKSPVKKKINQQPDPKPDVSDKSEVVSRIIHLGVPLSKRVHITAENFGVPIDDLLFAARKKAVAHFRAVLTGTKKPPIKEFEKGGETIRVAVALNDAEQAKLVSWFDPLDLGLGTKMVSPLLTEALRLEVTKICDASEEA